MTDDVSDFFTASAPEEPEEYGVRVYPTRIRPTDWEPTSEALAVGRGPGGPVFLGAFPSNSPEWHGLRKTRLGGSEVGQIVGASKYGSAYTLWHAKKSDEAPEDISHKPAIEWGHRLEPVVGAKLVENHPELALAPQVGTFCHSERPWQLANPDLLGPAAVGEVKTAGYDYAWGADGTDEIPLSYRCQVLWYMDVLGVDVAWICVLVSGRDYREYRVEYDLADALYLREQGAAFMQSLADSVEPEPDGGRNTLDAVAAAESEINGLDVQVELAAAREYEAACRAYEAAEDAKRAASAKLLQQIGAGRRAMVGETPIAARQRSRFGTTYLRIDGKLLATSPLPDPEPAEAPRSTTPSEGHIEDHLDWMLGRAQTKEQVLALATVLQPRLSDDGTERIRARYREVR